MSINIYMRLMDLGFNSTNVRFFSTWISQEKYDRLTKGFQSSLSLYSMIGFINAIILLVIAAFSNKVFNVSLEQDVILKNLFYILSVSAFCSWFSSCFDQIIKATENIAWIQKRTLLTKILMIGVLFATVYGDLTIEWYYALTCLATLAIVPLSIKKIKAELPFVKLIPKWDKVTIKEMLPYSINIFSFSLFQFSFYNLRPVFLGMQGSIESVADYRILNGIISIVTMLSGAFTGILLPSSAKVVANKNIDAYYRLAYDGTKYITILISFCCFGMMTVGRDVITLYVGESYLYLIPWFNLWLLCTLGTHNQAISSLILAGSDIRAISYNSVVASILGLLSTWFLIPYFQIGGVCIAFAIYIIIQIGFYYSYYWPVKMKIDSKKIFFCSFLPYVSLGATLYLIETKLIVLDLDSSWLSFFVKGGLFSIIFALVVLLTLNNRDKQFIMSNIKRK